MTTKKQLLASTLFTGALMSAGAAFAQVEAPTAEVGEVVITGSRISRLNLDSPVPVQVVDSAIIQATGQINVGDVIKNLPAAGVSAYTAQSTGFSTAGNGITTVSLRNLGEDRTLVLMNGRRIVAGVVGTQAVDLGTIPTEIIDRVDVVTGGASAVYGSDALAGVVNIITKRNFEGLIATAQYGLSERDDDERTKITLTAGANFADDRGNAVISFGWNKIGSIYARNRADQGMDIDAVNDYDGVDQSLIRSQTAGGFSSYSLYGYLDIPRVGLQQNGQPLPNVARVYDNGTVNAYTGPAYGFNRQSQRILQVPSEQMTFAGQMNYEVTPMVNFFAEVNYAKTTAFTEFEAFPLDSSDLYDENLAYCDDFDGDGDRECRYGVPLSSATVPTALRDFVRSQNPGIADDDLVVGFRRRIAEVDLRGNQVERQTFRAVLGFNGDIAPWLNYELSFNYGRTDDDQSSSGDVDTTRFRNAVDTVIVNGQQVCRDVAARAAGCVPLSVFGLNSITPEAADYVRIATSRDSAIEQYVYNGFIRGELPWELPAGNLNYVLGAEYRLERSRDTPDALTQSGQASGNATPETKGEFDVTEFFGELSVPLLRDTFLVNSLDLNLAARFSDYSTVGKTEAYAASLEYRPTDWLKLRAQFARAVRAPNIAELFQPAQQDFPSVNDICAGLTRTAGGQAAFRTVRSDTVDPSNVGASPIDTATINSALAVSCLADPALASRIARDGSFAITQAEDQGVSGFESGNPNLDPEKADTITVGFIFQPRWASWMEGFTASVDYYQIDIDKRIISLEQNQIVQLCYSNSAGYSATSQFCAPITRFTVGPQVGALQYVDNFADNFASTRTRGLDAQFSYRFNTETLGSLTAAVNYSHLFELTTIPFAGAAQSDYLREAGAVGAPRNKAQLNFTYEYGPIEVFLSSTLIGHGVIDTNPVGDYYNVDISGEAFHDIQVKYDLNDAIEIYGGVNNLTDNYAFIGGTNGLVSGITATQPTGWTTYPDIYDGIGRRWYVGVRATF